jgi:prepilin signal peptidase PulO-like enzyme (type II secretory pathway)
MLIHLIAGSFAWLFGLCVGSFLNVVIYRLPLGLSIADPPRSFCPHCRNSIAWYDNLPALSWLILRARCRHCGGAIALQYPLIEALTGLAFVLVYHLLFVADARDGLGVPQLPRDLPLLVAWLILAAALIASAAMDIALYIVDTRVTNAALVAGIVFYAVWPQRLFLLHEAHAPSVPAGALALLVGAATAWLVQRRQAMPDTATAETQPVSDATAHATPTRGGLIAGGLAVGLLVLLAAAHLVAMYQVRADAGVAPRFSVMLPHAGHGLLGLIVPASLLAFFIAVTLAGGQQRASDQEVAAAIEEEAIHARRTALHELVCLLPAIVAAVAVYLLLTRVAAAARGWETALAWPPTAPLAPVAGLSLALYGAAIASAAGWILRILFTLVFGREAFGTGDIYILAAAGAAAGWDIALLGLLLAVGLALAGWLLTLLLKRGGIIPFGPWLAIGIIAALWLNRPAADKVREYVSEVVAVWRHDPRLLTLAGGVMLAGSVAAVVIARLVRRVVEK